jgi:hypothetical protein
MRGDRLVRCEPVQPTQSCPEGQRAIMRGSRLVRCEPVQPTQSCPEGQRAIMRGSRLVRCEPVQTQSCQAGTRPLIRNGRIIRCMPMECPRHTTGTWPNCQAGGTQGTKPGDSATTNPRACPDGWSRLQGRCRPPRSEGGPGTGGTNPTQKPPETTRRECRPGTFGRWPHCRKIGGGGTTTGPTPKPTGPKVCPPGLSGPNCDRPVVR